MSNPEGYQPILGSGDLGSWTQEESIKYEIACEALGRMVAHCSAEIAKEEAKPNPDPAVLDRWNREQARYARERREIVASDVASHDRILRTYGPIIKARHEAFLTEHRGEC